MHVEITEIWPECGNTKLVPIGGADFVGVSAEGKWIALARSRNEWYFATFSDETAMQKWMSRVSAFCAEVYQLTPNALKNALQEKRDDHDS